MKVLHLASGLPTPERPYSQPFIKSQIDSLIHEGLKVEIYDIKGFNTPLNYIKSITHIRHLIDKKGIELIHAHYSYCGFTALKARPQNLPIVLSLMGNDILGNTDVNGNFTLRGKFDKSLGIYIANRVNHIIVKSEGMKNKLQLDPPISVIPNGVNFDVFKPVNQVEARNILGLNPNDFIILFLGDPNIAIKNFKLANDAVNHFIQKTNHQNIKLVNPFGIGQKDVVLYMNAANVLLLTSFMEGSPNVIKESMACNLPIISTDVGDVRKIILDTNNCFITDFSEEEISEKLSVIYKNRIRSDGREKIDFLRNDLIAKKIIELYQMLLKEKFDSKIAV